MIINLTIPMSDFQEKCGSKCLGYFCHMVKGHVHKGHDWCIKRPWRQRFVYLHNPHISPMMAKWANTKTIDYVCWGIQRRLEIVVHYTSPFIDRYHVSKPININLTWASLIACNNWLVPIIYKFLVPALSVEPNWVPPTLSNSRLNYIFNIYFYQTAYC